MTKKTFCPQCSSKKMKIHNHNPSLNIWKCSKCGYQGPVAVEDGSIEKNINEARKMEKLSRKLSKPKVLEPSNTRCFRHRQLSKSLILTPQKLCFCGLCFRMRETELKKNATHFTSCNLNR